MPIALAIFATVLCNNSLVDMSECMCMLQCSVKSAHTGLRVPEAL